MTTMDSKLAAALKAKYGLGNEHELGWHFVKRNGRTGYGDLIVRVGETLTVEGQPCLCEWGLHASPTIDYAYRYAPTGDVSLCLVWVAGQIDKGNDKFCGLQRHCLAMLTTGQTAQVLARRKQRDGEIDTVRLQYQPEIATMLAQRDSEITAIRTQGDGELDAIFEQYQPGITAFLTKRNGELDAIWAQYEREVIALMGIELSVTPP